MGKNSSVHVQSMVSVFCIRFSSGLCQLFDTTAHLFTSAVIIAALAGLWFYADAISAAHSTGAFSDLAQLANTVKAPFLKLLGILLVFLYVLLLGTPRGTVILQMAMQQAGIVNHAEETPYLIGRRVDSENNHLITLTWFPCGISLSTFEAQQDKIEAALNAYIIRQKIDRNCHYIIMDVVFGEDVQPELPAWDVSYMPQRVSQFALGVNLAGTPVITDLAKIPHILIGGSTGSGKSFLLKLILFQAVCKEYQVFIADFKGGLDYLGAWEDHCRMCLDKPTVLAALTEICEELNSRKQLFRRYGCRDIESFRQQYPENAMSLPHIIFACDEATAIFSKKQALKEEAEITKEIEAKAAYIAAQGRALGIHLILSLQRPDATVLDGQITNNIDYRICGRANQTLSKIVLDQTDAKASVPKDGNGVFMMNDGTIFQTYRINEAMLWKE